MISYGFLSNDCRESYLGANKLFKNEENEEEEED